MNRFDSFCLVGWCVTIILLSWVISFLIENIVIVPDIYQSAFAQQAVQEFDYENCHVYYFEKDIFVPFQILLYFPDADRGGFFYDSLIEDASYWIEKPEDFGRKEGTFLGIGSNSTKRWEWQFNMNYNQTAPLGRNFQMEMISNGATVVRNNFIDTKQDVCVTFNFNAEVQPKILTNDDILAIATGIAQDQIVAVRSAIDRNSEETAQGNNITIITIVISIIIVGMIYASSYNKGKQIDIQAKQLKTMVERTQLDRQSANRKQQYYELKLGDQENLIKTKMEKITDVLVKFRETETILNNIQFIYDFIKKNVKDVQVPVEDFEIVKVPPDEQLNPECWKCGGDILIKECTRCGKDFCETHFDYHQCLVEPFDTPIEKDKGIVKKLFGKFDKKKDAEKITDVEFYYQDYKKQMKEMNDYKKLEFVGKEWDKIYQKGQDPESEERKQLLALLQLDGELKK